MLLENYPEFKNRMHEKTVLLTGAGGGIGLQAAKAFLFMGATVVIAEIDKAKGEAAERSLNAKFPAASCEFYAIDLAREKEIQALYSHVSQKYGSVDVVFHNAAMTAMGNVEDVPLDVWDRSYRVNFRAPLELTRLFLPGMRANGAGSIVFVSSSGAAPYMGAYEVFKTAQTELCSTLAGELENTGVSTYTIGPGLVKTETAMREIEVVAGKMGMSTREFYAMNESHILGAEEAGCGFAVSVLLAERYHGQEIGSIQALLDTGIFKDTRGTGENRRETQTVKALLLKIIAVYEEQYAGWMARNIFERQWVLRDFKKTVGRSAEQFHLDMMRLKEEISARADADISDYEPHFERLKAYFLRQHKLLQGFEKDPQKLREGSEALLDWVQTLDEIAAWYSIKD